MARSKADMLMLSRVLLITLTTVEGALYGFAFALYIFCARSLYLQLEDRDRRRQHLFALVYMTFLMVFALCNLAVDSCDAKTSYVDHANYPYGTFANVFGGSPIASVGYVAYTLVGFMTSAIQIWRLQVVWKALRCSLFIVILLVLCLFAYLGLEVTAIVVHIRGLKLGKNELHNVIYYGGPGLTLFISITVTLLIIGRIGMARRTHIKLMGQTESSSLYTSIASMLIESFALESMWMIGCMSGSFNFSSKTAIGAVNVFFESTRPYIQVIAYLLVIHRVAMKRGWEEDTGEKLTTLQWNREVVQTTQTGTREDILITCEKFD